MSKEDQRQKLYQKVQEAINEYASAVAEKMDIEFIIDLHIDIISGTVDIDTEFEWRDYTNA